MCPLPPCWELNWSRLSTNASAVAKPRPLVDDTSRNAGVVVAAAVVVVVVSLTHTCAGPPFLCCTVAHTRKASPSPAKHTTRALHVKGDVHAAQRTRKGTPGRSVLPGAGCATVRRFWRAACGLGAANARAAPFALWMCLQAASALHQAFAAGTDPNSWSLQPLYEFVAQARVYV